jgi:hypothetical protein
MNDNREVYTTMVCGKGFICAFGKVAIPVEHIEEIDFNHGDSGSKVVIYMSLDWSKCHVFDGDMAEKVRAMFLRGYTPKDVRPIPGSGVERGKGKLEMGG